MSTSAQLPYRCIAVLNLPKHKTPAYIVRARAIVEAVGKSPWFPAPRPDLATVTSAIDALAESQAATHMGGPAETALRDTRRLQLQVLLEELRGHVQSVADSHGDSAPSIIESAGMSVKKVGGRRRTGFRLKDGRVSGQVDAFTDQAANRASYEWEYSLDGGASWIALPGTTKANTTITGLRPGARVWVRYRTVVKSVTGDWSNPLSIIVG
jgi:hypothetical protein